MCIVTLQPEILPHLSTTTFQRWRDSCQYRLLDLAEKGGIGKEKVGSVSSYN